jgi:hypothetical protein
LSEIGAVPTEAEIEPLLEEKAKIVIWKWHRGCAPELVDREWEPFYQEVRQGALRRLKNFRHGGPKSLDEFVYLACYFSLVDIQRRACPLSASNLRPKARAALEAQLKPQCWPLLDQLSYKEIS